MPARLTSLFKPKSVAVVGVSSDPEKLGAIVYHNILDGGFAGKVYPVNPKHLQLYGVKAYSSIEELPNHVELVCIVVPKEAVLNSVVAAASKKIPACIIITAGFGELGGEGKKLENQIAAIAATSDMTLLGPNCLGLLCGESKLNASFATGMITKGDIAFLSQSGACCSAIMDMAQATGVGFSHFVSLGNKADVSETDLIPHWLKDPTVKVLGAYLEEIEYGRTVIELYENAPEHKPCVMLKPGKSLQAKSAISSHTGSLAGSATIVETALAQHGITQVDTLRQLFLQMQAFSWAPLPKGNKVAILTNAGGPGIITTDELIDAGLELAQLTPETQSALKNVLPSTASTHNPVDIIGDARADRYRLALQVLAQAPEVDAVIILLTPQLMTQIRDTAQLIVAAARQSKKTILPVFIGGSHIMTGLQWLWAHQIPGMSEPADAVFVLKNLVAYSHFKTKSKDNGSPILRSRSKLREDIKKYAQSSKEPTLLPDDVVHQLARASEIVLPKQTLVDSIEMAEQFLADHTPVVLKIPSEFLEHKTEQKGVILNITTRQELATAFSTLAEYFTDTLKRAPKLLIQEQLRAGAEIFVGVQRDGNSMVYEPHTSGFGHHLTVGQGGIYTEIYKDVAHVLLPASQDELHEMLTKTKVFNILKGARGKQPLAYFKLLELISGVQNMTLRFPEIVSVDINPVLVSRRRAVAADLKVKVLG